MRLSIRHATRRPHELISLAAVANKDYRTAATEAHAVIALGGVPKG